MALETPEQLLHRLKLGSEEYCQRLLTSLILCGPYPRWNSRSTPAAAGLAFLQALYERSFDDSWPQAPAIFVDEFELPARHDAEKGGAPDYGVLWPDRLWLIELKTEKASHRAAQIPSYFELAHHHHPAAQVDLLYVTPPMAAPFTPAGHWARYAHTTWADVATLVRSAWPKGAVVGEQQVIDGLLAAIDGLHLKPGVWRAAMATARIEPGDTAAPPDTHTASTDGGDTPADDVERAVAAAELTANDGKQRAPELRPADLEDLLAIRLAVRDRLAASPPGSPLRHVLPWIWRPESSGGPMTECGRQHGMELRLSRYASPRY